MIPYNRRKKKGKYVQWISGKFENLVYYYI